MLLGSDEKTGGVDIVMDPSNPNTLIVSQWNRIRKRWSDPVPEDGDYLYKTTDAGKTWKKLTNGLPETKFTGRIGLNFSKSNPNVVYAYVDNHTPKREPKEGELDPYGRPIQVIPYGVQVYRSDDKGENWNWTVRLKKTVPIYLSVTISPQLRVPPAAVDMRSN
jgi:hypothetical protein